ncbi:MAG: hypothetical protein K6E78_07015 [Treponema sp.]|nr:hypothetical protein [Treponema sp.]
MMQKSEFEEAFLEPLDHIFEKRGLCSKRAFLTFIRENQVYVNEEKVSDRKARADIEKDIIKINGKLLPAKKHLYLMMNKPLDYVCTYNLGLHKNVYSLLAEKYLRLAEEEGLGKIHTIGRLDADSCGLLLFTTNGKFSNFITRPENHVFKSYYVELAKGLKKEEQDFYIESFARGIFLPEFKHGNAFTTKGCHLEFLSEKAGMVTLNEGKFRQIRRMFLELGNQVIVLKRLKEGKLLLPEGLKEGEVLPFGREDIF